MCWTLVSRVPSVGPSDIMFSATNATDEDRANLSPREKIEKEKDCLERRLHI